MEIQMNNLWNKQLPGEYRYRVVEPVAFERHAEPSAHAVKIIGFDSSGTKCFVCHSFMLREECFDIDEFPILSDVYYEQVTSWRLQFGKWLKLKIFADQLDRCNSPLKRLPLEFAETA
jgi:hypothetical protein